MIYYKNNNDIVSVYDNNFQVKNEELVKITEDEAIKIFDKNLIALKTSKANKIQEAKAYLANTDYKMLSHYVPKADEDLDVIIAKRNETREFIRNNE